MQPPLPPDARRRRRALALLAGGVVLLHGSLLQGLTPAPPSRPGGPVRPAMVLVQRVVGAAPRAAGVPAAPPPSPRPTRPPAGRDRVAALATAAPSAAEAAAPGPDVPQPDALRVEAHAADAHRADAHRADAHRAVAAAAALAPESASGEDARPPLYPAVPPAAAVLRYRLQRGAVSGEAVLSWQPQDARYELRLDAQLRGGRPLIEQRSLGAIEPTGLAPERFVDRRRGRAAQAANFQRESGRITFSGPTIELPAWPGAQDRVGWIVQLAAIQAAAPAPLPEITLFVVGARGGAGRWTFEARGAEAVATPFGTVPALHYERRPATADDLQVEVWLDPARGFWPVRLRWVPPRGGDALELLLAAEP